MPYTPSRLVERAWSAKPRCLASFQATPLRTPPSWLNAFDDLGFFDIACSCGTSSFRILGYPSEGDFFACPLQLECTGCRKIAEIFDVQRHGYDAELENGCYSIRGEGVPVSFRCPCCQAESFEVAAGFSYQIEPIEDLPKDMQDKLPDLFDCFYLEAVCTQCQSPVSVSNYECA